MASAFCRFSLEILIELPLASMPRANEKSDALLRAFSDLSRFSAILFSDFVNNCTFKNALLLSFK